MRHYKEFLIKLQTLDIRIVSKKLVSNNNDQSEEAYYDISHQSPHFSNTFRNELKELQELAVTDILSLSAEQIRYQLDRLTLLKEKFSKFWRTFHSSMFSFRNNKHTELLHNLDLQEIFIVPDISFRNAAIATEDFIDDLQDSIGARERALIEFEQSVLKIIQANKEREKTTAYKLTAKELPLPIFKAGVADQLIDLIKDYFTTHEQAQLKLLFTTGRQIDPPLLFKGSGNQLADAFKQLFEANLIIGCNKIQLINWIIKYFKYVDKGVIRSFSEKYLLDIISSNTKSCQSPILNVRKKDGEFLIVPLKRNNRNNKT
jgi:hypothetical protein